MVSPSLLSACSSARSGRRSGTPCALVRQIQAFFRWTELLLVVPSSSCEADGAHESRNVDLHSDSAVGLEKWSRARVGQLTEKFE